MTKQARRVVADGETYEICCALREDGSSPTSDLLDKLEEMVWPDPAATELPDEYQTSLRRRLIAHVEMLAEEGDLPRSAYNRLQDGIWELKVGNLRVSFYDTDGKGGFTAKDGESSPSWDGGTLHFLPEFDENIRLGHTFAKEGQQTKSEDIEACRLTREEDLAHDAPQ